LETATPSPVSHLTDRGIARAVGLLHGARFSVETGEALTPPAVKPVKTHEVKVEGDAIFVKLK
jgi:nitrite reductase/ring-hydroxylating ferredoxin subunit